jgi:hypothetical protein
MSWRPLTVLKIVEGILSARYQEEKVTTLWGGKAPCKNLGKPNFKAKIY